MSNQSDVKIAKWPFLLGDLILLAIAAFLCVRHGNTPLTIWEVVVFAACGALGAIIAIIPFIMEYKAATQMVQTSGIVSTVAQIQNLDTLALQISAATAQWQTVQEQSTRTAATAKEISTRMTTEAAAFTEFLQKSNDAERATLRLEIEKLRRSEGEFLQIIVRMLDHTYALHQAAVRSGQPALIEQLGQFQNSCRDVARRIGLIPFTPAADDLFDTKIHKTTDSQFAPLADAKVRDTLATGYTYQGQLLRPALVSLHTPAPDETTTLDAPPEFKPTLVETPATSDTTVKTKIVKAKVPEQTLL